jgi:hypothetical protein
MNVWECQLGVTQVQKVVDLDLVQTRAFGTGLFVAKSIARRSLGIVKCKLPRREANGEERDELCLVVELEVAILESRQRGSH